MDIVGEIVEILGTSHVLILCTKEITVGTKLNVFGIVEVPKLKEKYDLEYITIPKGQISITSSLKEKLYLGEVFTTKLYERTMRPGLRAGLLSNMLGEEVFNEKDGPPSALLDRKSLDFTYESTVKIGDKVGRL